MFAYPAERALLHARTGADAVDMESGALARSGRLVGCLRAISDTPTQRLGGVAEGATADGEVDYLGFLHGFARQPLVTLKAALGARRALKGLEAIALTSLALLPSSGIASAHAPLRSPRVLRR